MDSVSLESQYDDLARLIDSQQYGDARREAGELGEATAAGLIEVVGDGHLLEQHNPGDAPQGIDIAYFDDGDDRVHFSEVKTIGWGDYHTPRMNETLAGRQASDEWIADKADFLDLEASDIGSDEDQVMAEVIQIDVPGGAIGVFDVGTDGAVVGDPTEMYSLYDVTEAIDNWSADVTGDVAEESAEVGDRGL